MMDKQSLVIGLLIEKMADSKVGILAKGISDIQPAEIAVELSSQRKSHVYANLHESFGIVQNHGQNNSAFLL